MKVKKVLLSASWCAPCKNVKKWIEDFKISDLEVVDIEEDETDYVGRYTVKSVPTILIIDENGEEISRSVGDFGGNSSKFLEFLG